MKANGGSGTKLHLTLTELGCLQRDVVCHCNLAVFAVGKLRLGNGYFMAEGWGSMGKNGQGLPLSQNLSCWKRFEING